MNWSDQDVENAARHLLDRQGAMSGVRARSRSRDLENNGDTELAAVWSRIADAIARLQDESADDGSLV